MGDGQQSATKVVRAYLAAMEARDLAGAQSLLASGFTMVFPGGMVFTELSQLLDWARPRYRSVAKKYERFDEVPGDQVAIVYCYGTLHGVWPDGQPFDGIRFIDRFTVADGKLVDQMVWNDLAEASR